MSKFCGVISEQQPRGALQTSPLEFAHLDILSGLLLDETAELNEEYLRKMQFMHSQQLNLLQNEQQLVNVHYMMQELLPHITMLEMQVQENDEQLRQIQQRIHQMEHGCYGPGELVPNCCSEYGKLVRLIQHMDDMMLQLNNLMAKLADCIGSMQPRSNSFNIVYAVLDQHVRVLNQLEKNLDGLIDKSRFVDELCAATNQGQAAVQQIADSRHIQYVSSADSSNSSYC